VRKLLLCAFGCLLLAACAKTAAPPNPSASADLDETTEMGSSGGERFEGALYVDPSSVQSERRLFLAALKKSGHNPRTKRPLYESAIGTIGANGILDSLETLWPKCHSEAHALGAVIYSRVKNVGTGLRICADACYSGCMHGVLMEAFEAASDPADPDQHIDPARLASMVNDLCTKNDIMAASYSPGDCAHGVGHAMMTLESYDIPKAIKNCRAFDTDRMDYYCATGTYMEYVTENDVRDATEKSLLYPCDVDPYPPACARYKMVHVARRYYRNHTTVDGLVAACEALKGTFRLGCFHGLGNAHMGIIVVGKMNISDVCLHGTATDQFVCIEGAMERMAKFHLARAKEVCAELQGKNRETCDQAVANGMYNMEKDLTLYLKR
jgi:hypothetical protein